MEPDFSFKQMMQRYLPGGGYMGQGEPAPVMDRNLVLALARALEDVRNFDESAFQQFSLDVLLDYVRRTHSYYVFRKLPEIEQSISILLKDYTDGHPLLPIVHRFFTDYQKGLTAHIRAEETDLLPYIDYLLHAGRKGMDATEHFIRTQHYSLQYFMDHHHDTEMDIQVIEEAVRRYSPALTNQTPYRILVSQLEMLEKDLVVHGLVEDRILIPRIMMLERSLDNIMKERAEWN